MTSTSASPDTAARSIRQKRLRFAVFTSLGAKTGTLITQVVAMPIAARALGNDAFAVYSMLSAIMSWTTLASLGASPGLVTGIASSSASRSRAMETTLFSSALIPSGLLGAIASSCMLLVAQTSLVAASFGARYTNNRDSIVTGIAAVSIYLFFNVVLSTCEAVQAGYQEQFVTNVASMAGNAMTAVSLFWVATHRPTVVALLIAVYAPSTLARVGNACYLLRVRSHLLSIWTHLRWRTGATLLGSGAAYASVSLGAFCNNALPVVLVGRSVDAQSAAGFAALLNLFTLAFGLIAMIGTPLWPALADSIARGDLLWARSAYSRVLNYSMMYALCFVLLCSLIGPRIIRWWYGPGVRASADLCAWVGIYFIVAVWEYVHYTVLIGLKRVVTPSILYVVRSAGAVFFVLVLIPHFGAVGALGSLVASVLVVTAWSYPWMTVRTLKAAVRLDFRLELE